MRIQLRPEAEGLVTEEIRSGQFDSADDPIVRSVQRGDSFADRSRVEP